MGSTLGNIGPIGGSVAQGIMQGRQAATVEDQSRQEMALRAAAEGRQKEEHRLSIQQSGLAIRGQMQQQAFAEKYNPLQLQGQEYANRNAEGRPADSPYMQGLTEATGTNIPQGVSAGEAGTIASLGAGIKRAGMVAATSGGRADDAMARLKVQQTVMSKRAMWQRAAVTYDAAARDLTKALSEFPSVEGEADEPAVVEARNALIRAAREKRRLMGDHNAYISQFPAETGLELIPEEEDVLEAP